MKHHLDVGIYFSSFGGLKIFGCAMFHALSAPLQSGVCFFQTLIAAVPTACLLRPAAIKAKEAERGTVCLPCVAQGGRQLFHVLHN